MQQSKETKLSLWKLMNNSIVNSRVHELGILIKQVFYGRFSFQIIDEKFFTMRIT